MAILGNNTRGASSTGAAAGRMFVTKATLASAATMTELHGWFGGTSGTNAKLVIYADTAGSPGTRLAYTNSIPIGVTDPAEISQAGFSVALAAGDYWIGWIMDVNGAGTAYYDTSGSYAAIFSGANFTTPPNPFGTPDGTGVRSYSCWAVVGSAAVTPVADFTATPTSGTASLSVAFTDTSTNTPTSWAWTFGDGGTSTSQSPTHSYTTSGVYTVTLIATNSAGSNTKTRTGYITVAEAISYASGGGIEIW